ncbi:MAG TPA: LamG domain-containing protein [Candidatus Nanoarchaeia archaeon]|nr:LamG domain-containing protein [Candidatus Nanoarchaeia archaeon]
MKVTKFQRLAALGILIILSLTVLITAVHNNNFRHRTNEACSASSDCNNFDYCDQTTRTCLSKRADYQLCADSEQCLSYQRGQRNGGCLEVPARSIGPTSIFVPLSFEGGNPTTATGKFCLPAINVLNSQDTNQNCYADGQCPQQAICRQVQGLFINNQGYLISQQKYCLGTRFSPDLACNDHVQCTSGICEGNVCRESRLAADAVCTVDAQCSSARCLRGRCQRAPTQPELTMRHPVVQYGGIAEITWTTFGVGPGGCSASGSGANELRYPANSPTDTWSTVNQHSGSFRVRLNQPRTFTLTCSNGAGTATQTVTIDPVTAPRIPNPFVYYNFEQEPPRNLQPDSSIYGQPGEMGGVANGEFRLSSQNPLNGNAYVLDGVDDHIRRDIRGEHLVNFDSLNNLVGYYFPNGWTISFWVKPNNLRSLNGDRGLLSWRENLIARGSTPQTYSSQADSSYVSYLNLDSENGRLRWYLDGEVRGITNNQRMVNSWNNIVITNEGNQYYLFLNGNLQDSYVDQDNSFTDRQRGARTLHIGAAESNGANGLNNPSRFGPQPVVYFNGLLDEFKFFSYGIKINDVSLIYRELARGKDRDNDMVFDVDDNCPDNANSDQADSDSDRIGNVCEVTRSDGPPAGITSDGPPAGITSDGPPARIISNSPPTSDGPIAAPTSTIRIDPSTRPPSGLSIVSRMGLIREIINQIIGNTCTDLTVPGCSQSDVDCNGLVDVRDVFAGIDALKNNQVPSSCD